jgi:aerobic carbon-monoxide dehydrogenase small subunit
MTDIAVIVNKRKIRRSVDDNRLLVHFLRQDLGLTGTHIGCDTTQCGACVVDVDGRTVKSCTVLATQADGCTIMTIEGVAVGDRLHPVQEAFHRHHALQCGFCTPGLIMTAIDLIEREGPSLTEAAVRHELKGNICRCTGYQNVVTAILDAAAELNRAPMARSLATEAGLGKETAE